MVEQMFKNTPQQREADAGANALAEIGKTAKKVCKEVGIFMDLQGPKIRLGKVKNLLF